jgi:hypothetical protein
MVIATLSNRTRIQNAIRERAEAHVFPTVEYSTAGAAEIGDEFAVPEPNSVFVNEVGSTFGPNGSHGRSLQYQRERWRFLCRMTFPREVALEEFEATFRSPINLAPESANELDRVHIALVETSVIHPAQHEPNVGTQVSFIFEVTDFNP